MKDFVSISAAQQIKSILFFACINIISNGEDSYTRQLIDEARQLAAQINDD